jgi:hypothetical protein
MRWTWLIWMGCSGTPTPQAVPDPGSVTLHRLNRAEYDNTVRDLFGTALRPAKATFPVDDFGYGFDNNADVLSLSPLHLEMYQLASDQLLDELFGWGNLPSTSIALEAESDMTADGGAVHDVGSWMLWNNGSLQGTFYVDTAGTWTATVTAEGQQAGDDQVSMSVHVDGQELGVFAVEQGEYAVDTALDVGLHKVEVTYLNDWELPPDEDRNLIVDRVVLTGPIDLARQPSPFAEVLLACDDDDDEARCAETVVRRFGKRAWRRPMTSVEFEAKMALYGTMRGLGGDWNEGIGAAMQGILMSPHFVYRVERDPIDGVHDLNAYELATRLSYFLWSSMPDEELLARAEDGSLLDEQVLDAQARRMLAHPHANALVDNFAGQLLYLRAVEETSPSIEDFPSWDPGLRAGMEDEMRLFFRDILLSDQPMSALLTANWTYVDARLAAHYGLAPVDGVGFQRVSLDGTPRQGLLTMAGLLTATSYPNRTAPVLRGKWVLDNLMCAAPPPPPQDVIDSFPEIDTTGLSQREVMALHQADPVCASCHATMDPIGLVLENFDAIGAYRDVDSLGDPIDSEVSLPDGTVLADVRALSTYLAEHEAVRSCWVEKAFVYALGRGLLAGDAPYLEEIERSFLWSDLRFGELSVAIVKSEPFRMRSSP